MVHLYIYDNDNSNVEQLFDHKSKEKWPAKLILFNTCHLDWRGPFFQFPVSSNTILKSKLPKIANWMLACKLAYDATCVVHQLINFFFGVPCASLFFTFFIGFWVPELIGILKHLDTHH